MSAPRPLGPVMRPTAFANELLSSFTNRLRCRLHAPHGYLPSIARSHGVAVAELVERKGALPTGSLVQDARFTDDLTGPRFLCGQCSEGELVELAAHLEHFCCLTHAVWTGACRENPPHVPVATVREDVLAADRAYRALRREGRAEPGPVTQAAWIVSAPGADARWAAPVTVHNYVAVVAVLTLLTDRAFLADILVEDSSAARRAVVSDAVQRTLGHDDVASRLLTVMNRAVDLLDSVDMVLSRLNDMVMFDAEPGAHDAVRPAARTLVASHHTGVAHAPRRRPRTPARRPSPGPTATRYRARLAHASLALSRPDLAAQWHPTLNGTVTPSHVTRSSNSQQYWWHCDRCGHNWAQNTNNRSRGRGCPACAGRTVTAQNCLATVDPDLAAQWDTTGNGPDLTAGHVTHGSGRRVSWRCRHGHRYPARVDARSGRRTGCPVCRNIRVVPGVNDLATTFPAVAEQWHPTRNGRLTPQRVPAGARTRVHWWCARHRHTWRARVCDRTTRGHGCPVCADQVIVAGVNDLATSHPHLASTWAGAAGEPSPSDVSAGSGRVLTWQCTNGLGHTFQRTVAKRVANDHCPVCTNHVLLPGFNDVATRYPELARDWDTERNGVRADQTLPGNAHRWWTCANRHTKSSTVPNRLKTHGCPGCAPGERVLRRTTRDASADHDG